jgi:antitoxin (DNA-binding transcriptional repressor) of toxin-antitoxin stability system
MKISVSEFKTKCTKIIRDVENLNQTVEITKRGKIVAIVTPPASPKEIDPHEFLGCLHGTVTYAPDWDQSLGDKDWEACR